MDFKKSYQEIKSMKNRVEEETFLTIMDWIKSIDF